MATKVDLTPPEIEYRVKRGDTFSDTISDLREDDILQDVSGDTFQVEVRRSPDKAVAATMDVDLTFGSSGQVTFSLDDDAMRGLAGKYKFDVEWERASDGRVVTLLDATLIAEKDITE